MSRDPIPDADLSLDRIADALERIADAAGLWAKPSIQPNPALVSSTPCSRCGIHQSRCGTVDCPRPAPAQNPGIPSSGRWFRKR